MAAPPFFRFGIDDADPSAGPLLAVAVRRVVDTAPLAKAQEGLRALLRDGRRGAAALRFGTALLVRLSPPPLSPSKLRRILPSLLSAELPFPLSDCRWRIERAPDGACVAHVVRRADLAARLDELRALGCDPAAVVPPGPALWREARARLPLPDGAPRAVFFAAGDRTLLATGRGAAPDAVAVFPSADATEALRRLRLAFGGLPGGLSVLVAGAGHAPLAEALRAVGLAPVVPERPEAFLAAALASPAVADLDLRLGEDAHPSARRSPFRALSAAALLFLAASALALGAVFAERRRAAEDARAALRARAAALDGLAGYHVAARGAAGLAEARRAAAESRDPAVADPGAAPALAALPAAAAARGVRLGHLEASAAGLSASGTAPDAAAAEAFAADLRAAGVRAVLSEAPAPAPGGRVAFFVHPSAAPQP